MLREGEVVRIVDGERAKQFSNVNFELIVTIGVKIDDEVHEIYVTFPPLSMPENNLCTIPSGFSKSITPVVNVMLETLLFNCRDDRPIINYIGQMIQTLAGRVDEGDPAQRERI